MKALKVTVDWAEMDLFAVTLKIGGHAIGYILTGSSVI